MTDESDLEKLAEACRAQLGPQSGWFQPTGYPDGLAPCIIDSIHSTGAHCTSVVNVLSRYRGLRGDAVATDGTAELLGLFGRFDGPRGWTAKVRNYNPASTKEGVSLKAAVIHDVAQRLHHAGIRTASQFRQHGELAEGNEDRRAALKALWTSAEAQRSGNHLRVRADARRLAWREIRSHGASLHRSCHRAQRFHADDVRSPRS